MTKKQQKNVSKNVGLIFGITGALLLFIVALRVSHRYIYPVLLDKLYETQDSIAQYKRTCGMNWVSEDPYAIFPELDFVNQAEQYDYSIEHHVSLIPQLFDDDIVVILSCVYQEADFSAEVDRLQRLCGNIEEEYHSYPAFDYTEGMRGDSGQYALLDVQENTIYYICYQGWSIASKIIPKELH